MEDRLEIWRHTNVDTCALRTGNLGSAGLGFLAVRQSLSDDTSWLRTQQLLVMFTGSKQGLKVDGSVGLRSSRPPDSVTKGSQLAVSQKIRDVEIDLSENAVQLGKSQLCP